MRVLNDLVRAFDKEESLGFVDSSEVSDGSRIQCLLARPIPFGIPHPFHNHDFCRREGGLLDFLENDGHSDDFCTRMPTNMTCCMMPSMEPAYHIV